MFVGHLGVGLALSSRSRRFRLGTFLGATLLLDVLLGVFVLAGMEQIVVPPDFATGHFLEFVLPLLARAPRHRALGLPHGGDGGRRVLLLSAAAVRPPGWPRAAVVLALAL